MVAQHPPVTTATSAHANTATDNQLEQMQEELQQLRKQLDQCKGNNIGQRQDKSIEQMDQELGELHDMLRKFEAEEARTGKRGSHNTLHGEIQHLKTAIARLEKFGRVSASF